MNKFKKLLYIIGFITILFMLAVIFSYKRFRIYNPCIVARALWQISAMEKDYIQIQEYPKIVVAKTGLSLEAVMKEAGYQTVEIGAASDMYDGILYEFGVSEHLVYILEKPYDHYAVWMWRE